MPSGGHARSGPPPDPHSLRAAGRDAAEWRRLPSEGRPGDPPAWPEALGSAKPREKTMWAQLWSKPQAIVWEELGQHDLVGQYVRAFVVAGYADAKAADRTVMRQLADELGLTIGGMARHRWIIDSQQQETVTAHGSQSGTASVKDRFKVIEGRAAS